MANPTLAELRTSAKYRANMEQSDFVTTAEWNEYLNYAISDLRDKLISKVGDDYFATSQDISLASGTESYALPADFYKLLWAEMQSDNTNWFKLRRFEVTERNRGAIITASTLPDIRYRLRAGFIMFSPVNQLTGQPVRIWYVPIPEKLTDDSDILTEAFNGWDEYVVISAARKALVKEESDTSQLDAEFIVLNQRIEAMATNRDQAEPMRMYDNSTEYNSTWPWR